MTKDVSISVKLPIHPGKDATEELRAEWMSAVIEALAPALEETIGSTGADETATAEAVAFIAGSIMGDMASRACLHAECVTKRLCRLRGAFEYAITGGIADDDEHQHTTH